MLFISFLLKILSILLFIFLCGNNYYVLQRKLQFIVFTDVSIFLIVSTQAEYFIYIKLNKKPHQFSVSMVSYKLQ